MDGKRLKKKKTYSGYRRTSRPKCGKIYAKYRQTATNPNRVIEKKNSLNRTTHFVYTCIVERSCAKSKLPVLGFEIGAINRRGGCVFYALEANE